MDSPEEQPNDSDLENEIYEINEHGFPVLKKKEGHKTVTSEDIYKMMEELGI